MLVEQEDVIGIIYFTCDLTYTVTVKLHNIIHIPVHGVYLHSTNQQTGMRLLQVESEESVHTHRWLLSSARNGKLSEAWEQG